MIGGEADFLASVLRLADDPGLRREMGVAARRKVLCQSWDHVFENVYSAYAMLENHGGNAWNARNYAASMDVHQVTP